MYIGVIRTSEVILSTILMLDTFLHFCMYCICCFFQFGNVLEHNFTKAFEIFTKLADEGSPAGQQVSEREVH